jgi:hypothetical protein
VRSYQEWNYLQTRGIDETGAGKDKGAIAISLGGLPHAGWTYAPQKGYVFAQSDPSDAPATANATAYIPNQQRKQSTVG